MQKVKLLMKLRDNLALRSPWEPETTPIDEAIERIRKDTKRLPLLSNDLKASLDVVSIPRPYLQFIS